MSAAKKSAIWFTVCSILQKGISFITVPIFTRLMPQSDYGTYQVYQSWCSFFLVFTSLNMASGSFNKAMILYDKQKNEYVSSIQSLTSLITVLWIGAFLLFPQIFVNLTHLKYGILVCMFAELFFEPAFLLWAAKQRFEFAYKKLVLITLGIAIFSPVIGIIAVYFSLNKADAKIISGACVVCVVYLILYIVNFKQGKKEFCKEYWKYALSLPYASRQ